MDSALGRRARRALVEIALVAGLVAAVVVTGFAGEQVVSGALIAGGADGGASVVYALGLAGLVLVHVAVWMLPRRHPELRLERWWSVGISTVGVVCFSALALLSAGFSIAAGAETGAEAWAVVILYLLAAAGPPLGSLLSSVAALVRTRRSIRPAVAIAAPSDRG
ncbi:hypothetical protein [Herbiconiux sp. UC225_62]|uniref:hypothetical protein n=1 Tax=Herbiconiux sp. UC225_62 TaxID=3350168 RepID=UPI0036D27E87